MSIKFLVLGGGGFGVFGGGGGSADFIFMGAGIFPYHGSRSSREIKIQNASCQMGVVAKLQGDKSAAFGGKMSGRKVTRR